MRKVRRDELVDYQTWAAGRATLLPDILAIKHFRRIHVGEYLTFLFENTATVHYQVQERMRVEQIVREKDIAHELDTYNELLGADGELGCVLLIEIDDEAERAIKLVEWLDLPRHLYVIANKERFYATFDERQIGDTRVSAVQYLKFNTRGETPSAIGSDHPALTVEATLSPTQVSALRDDLTL